MKWDEMSPRERDALVTVKVMGLELCKTLPSHCFRKESSFPQVIPHYTTDISAAWEVVQKMPTLGKGIAEEFDEFVMDSAWYLWEVTPEKICLAALRAMGVEIE